MDELVGSAFDVAMSRLKSELELMPLERWNESVFRYFFCRALTETHPDVSQFVECDRIDLVLCDGLARGFVEFKFYLRPSRFDPYSGAALGFKGGPGSKNLGEFRACVDLLHRRRSEVGLSKYVVLVYADPAGSGVDTRRYATDYDAYEHTTSGVTMEVLRTIGPVVCRESSLSGRLYAIT